MGDERRFDVFADFIQRNFPPGQYPRVADAAGGRGLLSLALQDRGYEATVIDIRRSGIPKRLRKARRKIDKIARPKQLLRSVEDADLSDFDLIVGMHPDGATEAIAHAAATLPAAIVPCCNYWRGLESQGAGSVSQMIERLWQRLGMAYRKTLLPMNGKNVVLWTTAYSGHACPQCKSGKPPARR